MKYTRTLFTLIFSIAVLFLTQQVYAQALSVAKAQELLNKTDNNTAFYGTDFSARYYLVQEKPGQGKSTTDAVMYRRDSASSYTIIITGPDKDKGKGYVQYDNSIWFFDPADRQFVYTNSHDKFQGSNANNSDFTPQHYTRDYKIVSAERVKLGSLNCVQFTLSATAKDIDYPTVKLWVTEDDALIRKKEDYSLSGQLLLTTAIPSYKKYSSYSVPDKMLIVDNLRGQKINGKMQYEKTQITISEVSFAKQPDTVYTKKYIEMKSTK